MRLSPGESVERRRLHGDLPRADRAARRRQRRHRRADLARRGARRAAGATSASRCARRATTTRPRTRSKGADLALLRGRGHQRGRRALGPAPRLLAGGAARPRLARAADRAAPTASFADSRRRSVQAIVIAALAERYRRRPAAGGLPGDRLAARGLDLDRRRASRVLGALVAAWPSPEARLRRVRSLVRGARGPRALARPRIRGGVRPRRCWCCWPLVALVVARPLRRPGARSSAGRGRSARSSRRPRRPSTARSATPSSTTAWASSREEDWRAVDRELRAEAIEILRG